MMWRVEYLASGFIRGRSEECLTSDPRSKYPLGKNLTYKGVYELEKTGDNLWSLVCN